MVKKMKINDRLLLGALTGLIANIPKLLIGRAAIKLKLAEINGPETAAGIFIPPHKLTTTTGMAVGFIADSVIAGILGTVTVYTLSITGKDKYAIKGILMGQIMWQTLYGLLGSFGGSQVRAYSPKTVLSELVAHSAFGLTATAVAANIGDERLFKGSIPLSAGSSNASADTQQFDPLQSEQGYVKTQTVQPKH
jgi:hypothetical protein